MLNPGKYIARASEAAWSESANGNFYMTIRFKVTQGNDTDATVTKRLHFTDAAYERSVVDLRTCGWQGEDPTAIGPGNLDGLDFNEVSIVVEHEPYQDSNTGEEKMAATVRWINDLSRSAKPLESRADAGKLRAFGAQLKARVRAMDAASRASGTQTAQPARQPVQQPAQGARTAPTQARVAQSSNGPQRAAQAPQRGNQPPPRVHGQGGDEFGDDAPPF